MQSDTNLTGIFSLKYKH